MYVFRKYPPLALYLHEATWARFVRNLLYLWRIQLINASSPDIHQHSTSLFAFFAFEPLRYIGYIITNVDSLHCCNHQHGESKSLFVGDMLRYLPSSWNSIWSPPNFYLDLPLLSNIQHPQEAAQARRRILKYPNWEALYTSSNISGEGVPRDHVMQRINDDGSLK
jgi:hypothetical protein